MTIVGIIGVFLAVVSGAPAGAARSNYDPPKALWRDFVATKVSDGGRRTPFSRATNIEASLTDRSDYKFARGQWIGWGTGCNSAGARVKVSPQRLDVGLVSSTAKGCPAQEEREESWLSDFFEADPRWQLSGSHLMLRAGEREVRLRPKR